MYFGVGFFLLLSISENIIQVEEGRLIKKSGIYRKFQLYGNYLCEILYIYMCEGGRGGCDINIGDGKLPF